MTTDHCNTAAEHAADAVIALINSKAQSPTNTELVSVLSRFTSDRAAERYGEDWAPLALSPQHKAYRALLAEAHALPTDDEEGFNAMMKRLLDMERQIWATPARTLGDVLLRAEVAHTNENGVMDDLDKDEAFTDDRAFAQLIRAVLDVLGGTHAQ
jgi:hypothetical protein